MTAKAKDPYPLLAAFAPVVRAALIEQFERGEVLSVEQAEALGVPHLANIIMTPRGEAGGLVAFLVHKPSPARDRALGDVLQLGMAQEKSA